MAADQTIETQFLSATQSGVNYATFEGGIQSVKFYSDVDCYIDFDQPIDSGAWYLKGGANDNQIDFHGGSVIKIYANGVNGTAALRILGIRN